ncbi:MAG: YkgJ family cysteine cluster protein [Desulfobacterales bacterium]
MKSLDIDDLKRLPGRRLFENDTFSFRCHSEIECFNKCCRNLNLYLYPYDVIRLKNSLKISSNRFLDHHVDVVLRSGNFFPAVLLKMKKDEEKTCPFLTPEGCSVYPDRPDSCRTFPLELGLLYNADSRKTEQICLFRPPDFCLGQYEKQEFTVKEWIADQDAVDFNRMTARWSEIKALFQNDPWQGEGPDGKKGKMAFMSLYNMDEFRKFVFQSSFLKRYKIKKALLKTLERDDIALMKFGFSWVKLFLFGNQSKQIRPR